jgi:hypothetical protein
VRRFDSLRVWELDPEELVRSGPGPATLVGRTRTALPRHVGKAARVIMESTAGPERNDLLFILQALCGERYTPKELARLIPREAVMASVMFAKEFRQARKQARAEGRVEAARGMCLDVVKHLHPAALARVAPVVSACDSLPTLRSWTVAAARLPASELVRFVTSGPHRRVAAIARRRAPRPARRSAARRSR